MTKEEFIEYFREFLEKIAPGCVTLEGDCLRVVHHGVVQVATPMRCIDYPNCLDPNCTGWVMMRATSRQQA